MKVVAFDIDGTLTEQKALDVYKKLEQQSGTTTGIITSKSKEQAKSFTEDNDLTYEFLDTNLLKFLPLRGRGITYSGNPEIYVGNTMRDMFSAKLAGWEFVHVSNVDAVL